MPNHASTSLCHPLELRALTLREYAAIQEFPADWEFCGSPMEQYTQAGNAVPLRLGRVVGTVISNKMDTLSKRAWKPYAKVPLSYNLNYIQSHVRTRQWYKAGETYVWNDGSGDNGTYAAPKTILKSSVIRATPGTRRAFG